MRARLAYPLLFLLPAATLALLRQWQVGLL